MLKGLAVSLRDGQGISEKEMYERVLFSFRYDDCPVKPVLVGSERVSNETIYYYAAEWDDEYESHRG